MRTLCECRAVRVRAGQSPTAAARQLRACRGSELLPVQPRAPAAPGASPGALEGGQRAKCPGQAAEAAGCCWACQAVVPTALRASPVRCCLSSSGGAAKLSQLQPHCWLQVLAEQAAGRRHSPGLLLSTGCSWQPLLVLWLLELMVLGSRGRAQLCCELSAPRAAGLCCAPGGTESSWLRSFFPLPCPSEVQPHFGSLCRRYRAAIDALHAGIQCGSCGLRLATSQGYAQHLDWHFACNRRRRAVGRAAAHRQWYCSSAVSDAAWLLGEHSPGAASDWPGPVGLQLSFASAQSWPWASKDG